MRRRSGHVLGQSDAEGQAGLDRWTAHSIGGLHNRAQKVAVREAPENGKANQAVIAALAVWLERPESSVEITAGLSSR